MKKLIFFFAMLFIITSGVQAQINTRVQKKQVKTTPEPVKIIKTIPPKAPPPPPPSNNKNTGADNPPAAVYTLTSMKVHIRTGNDNKEFPSKVSVTVWKKDISIGDYENGCIFYVFDLKNEMAVNSNTDIGLEKYKGNPDKFSLVNLQKSGLSMRVSYGANFFMDAWKVENISLTLEFKDQNGNLHPTLGRKTISFSNAIGFLNDQYSYFKCLTDNDFNPLTASIEKR